MGRAHWECDDYCYGCKFRLSNVGLSNCHDYRSDIKVIFTRSIEEIKTEKTLSQTNSRIIYMSVGCAMFALIVVAIVMYYKKKLTQNKSEQKSIMPKVSDVQESVKAYGLKITSCIAC